MLEPHKEANYPYLRPEGYRVSSQSTESGFSKYNCVALAVGGDSLWWEPATQNSRPIRRPGQFWPDNIPPDDTLDNYVRLFELRGYERCVRARVELLYEKIALYGDSTANNFNHVAYQLYFGWISKLGDWQDIQHKTLKALENDAGYGHPVVIMRRRCNMRGFFLRACFNMTVRFWPMRQEDR
jgi:hypothetical protein